MSKLVIFGNGALAQEAFYNFERHTDYEVAGFVVDRAYVEGDAFMGRPIVPFDEMAERFPPEEHDAFVGVGYVQLNKLRAERLQAVKAMGYTVASFIHPTVDRMEDCVVGENCFIGAFTQIQFDVRIEDNVFIGTGSIVGHGATIQKHCFIGLRTVIPGWVTVSSYCFIAPGVTLRNKITIAPECVIGAGATVLENTEQGGVYIGQGAEQLPVTSAELPLQ
jgi:sugar O-acyltransferase (sialic acid O-acetyltransferase NeuD family)